MSRYIVTLDRKRFETATFELEAESFEDAEAIASARADRYEFLALLEWAPSDEPEDEVYVADVEVVRS